MNIKKTASLIIVFSVTWILKLNAQWKSSFFPIKVDALDMTTNGSIVYAANEYRLFQSTDIGLTWTLISTSDSSFDDRRITKVFAKDTVLFIGTDWYGIYRSIDNGKTWYSSYNGYIQDFAIKGSNIYVAGYGLIHCSTDNGLIWSSIAPEGIENHWVYALSANNDYLFSYIEGQGIGRYEGTEWNFFPIEKRILSLVAVDNRLFGGTDGGVFIIPQITVKTGKLLIMA